MLHKLLNAIKMRWSKLPTKARESKRPVPEGPWPSGKYQQDASTFEELAQGVERQKRVRAMEIAAGDSLTDSELLLKAVTQAVNRAASESAVDHPPRGAHSPPPIVLEVQCEVLPAAECKEPPTTRSEARAGSAPAKAPQTRRTSAESKLSVVPPPALRDLAERPPERSIDTMLHSLLHERKWLTPAERAKLDRAYQAEKYRAGLVQDPDPMKAIVFRRFVPPERPPGFWAMSATNRMWYCRMEELWQFRQEDAALAASRDTTPALPPPRKRTKSTKAIRAPKKRKQS